MSISNDYWSTFINVDADGTRDIGTPRLSEGIIYSCTVILILVLQSSGTVTCLTWTVCVLVTETTAKPWTRAVHSSCSLGRLGLCGTV